MVSSASVPIISAALSEDHTTAEAGSNNRHSQATTRAGECVADEESYTLRLDEGDIFNELLTCFGSAIDITSP